MRQQTVSWYLNNLIFQGFSPKNDAVKNYKLFEQAIILKLRTLEKFNC